MRIDAKRPRPGAGEHKKPKSAPRPRRVSGVGAMPRRSDRLVERERNYIYDRDGIDAATRAALLTWLESLHPLWEQRYSTSRPPPRGKVQRPLLRPVYWLGNWQFACLGYYEPPRRRIDCAVAAEPFPAVLANLVGAIERRIRGQFHAGDVPRDWHLNTCLVNFYGHRRDGAGWVDVARVGEHRDFEPGPVASISLGERGRFQFVRRGETAAPPVRTEWLEDRSLQAFGGAWWKDALLHRVQRVEDKAGVALAPQIDGFRTRRINLTFRYVPECDVVPFARLSERARDDVREYIVELARHSAFFRKALAG